MRPLLVVPLSALLLGSLALTGSAANVRRFPAPPSIKRYQSQARPLPPASTNAPEGTLLDEVGRLRRQVSPAESAAWQKQLHVRPAKQNRLPPGRGAERLARLHLWLGEYRLAGKEDPDAAKWHFRQAIALCEDSRSNLTLAGLKGRAAYDFAIARYLEPGLRPRRRQVAVSGPDSAARRHQPIRILQKQPNHRIRSQWTRSILRSQEGLEKAI